MAKLTLTDPTSLSNEQSFIAQITTNNTAIETAMEKTLSRDGTSPNSMEADLDMNSNQILNLPDATTDQEPVTFGQFNETIEALETGGVISASFVTLGTDATLSNERVLTAGNHIDITDAGAGSTVTIDVDEASLYADTGTLTNKTIDLASNTLTGTTAAFNTALSDNNFATQAGSETLTNKTLALGSNTVSGTTAQFNTALTDGDFATLAGTETLTNKTVSLGSNTVSGTTAQFNTALSDNDFATLAGTETLSNKTLTTPVLGAATATSINKVAITAPATSATLTIADGKTLTSNETFIFNAAAPSTVNFGGGGAVVFTSDTGTLTNKTIALGNNTISGTTAQFNTANTDGDFATIAGTETLTNKTLTSPVINVGSDAQGDVYYRNGSGAFTRLAPGTSGQFLKTQGAAANPTWDTPAGAGDFTGPGSSTDNAVVRFDSTTGKLGQNSVLIVSDTGAVTGATDITASGAVSAATVAGAQVATQAQMETGTATNLIVSPGRQHFHPGMAKAWAHISSAGTVTAGYNIASASKFATGIYDIDLTNAMSGTSAFIPIVTGNSNLIGSTTAVDTNTVRANFRTGGGVDTDTNFFLVVFGDM